MASRKILSALILPELQFTTSRSSGPGGQHANKVETRVQVSFNVEQSEVLTQTEKTVLKEKYANKLTKEGALVVACEDKRSQAQNKEIAIKKMVQLLNKALEKPKKRKPTQPSKAAKLERLASKKKLSDKKSLRRKISGDE